VLVAQGLKAAHLLALLLGSACTHQQKRVVVVQGLEAVERGPG